MGNVRLLALTHPTRASLSRSKVLCTLAAFVVCSFVFPHAEARILRFDYTSKILSISLVNGATDTLGLAEGQIVNGSFLYDERVADTDPDGNIGFYPSSVFNMRFDGFFAPKPEIDYSYLFKGALVDQVAAYANVVEVNISDVYEFNIYSVTGPDVILDDQFALTQLRLEDYPECTSTSACVFFQRAWLQSGLPTPVTFVC
jgi:hypothetical protein